MLLVRGSRQRAFEIPSVYEASAERPESQPCAPRPFCETMRLVIEGESSAVPSSHLAPIVALFLQCRPSAILWRVRTVVVDAIQLAPRWLWPHVGEERAEVVTPAVTHGDAASAPVRVARVSGVVTARFRVAPGVILWRATASWFAPMFRASRDRDISGQTSAAAAQTVSQVSPSYGSQGAAVASAQPLRISRGLRLLASAMKHAPASESLAGQVYEFHAMGV